MRSRKADAGRSIELPYSGARCQRRMAVRGPRGGWLCTGALPDPGPESRTAAPGSAGSANGETPRPRPGALRLCGCGPEAERRALARYAPWLCRGCAVLCLGCAAATPRRAVGSRLRLS